MLHGEIKVNDVAVGYWEAVRADKVSENSYFYDCEVQHRNLQGYPLRAKFRVTHYVPAGAVALTATILSAATRQLAGPVFRDEERGVLIFGPNSERTEFRV